MADRRSLPDGAPASVR